MKCNNLYELYAKKGIDDDCARTVRTDVLVSYSGSCGMDGMGTVERNDVMTTLDFEGRCRSCGHECHKGWYCDYVDYCSCSKCECDDCERLREQLKQDSEKSAQWPFPQNTRP